jgi:aminoglycoside phosphotransferase
MSMVLHFLDENRERLDLARFGAGGRLASLMLTPRFHASSHVVCLILADGRPDPVLVAKIPRLGGPSATLEREAANLRRVQALRPEGWPGVPRLVAFETHEGWPILVETALAGRAYDRAKVRRDPARASSEGAAWLADLAAAGRTEPRDGTLGGSRNGELVGNLDMGDRCEPRIPAALDIDRLVEQPLDALRGALPLDAEELRLIERTRALVAPLRASGPRAVFEHGDFSAPNVMRLADGSLGVVDWELADPAGLPAADLFFWLTYVAFARSGARTLDAQVEAFRAAFFGESAWARRHVVDYADRVGLGVEALTPLFAATWARTIAGLVGRLAAAGDALAAAGGSGAAAPDAATMTWLRGNRYFTLWRCAVAQADELDWDSGCGRKSDDAGGARIGAQIGSTGGVEHG